MNRLPRQTILLVALLARMAPSVALAGLGPENVLLVVNANRDGSKEVANHYVRLRNLPPTNVVYLDYDGSLESIPGKQFREQILVPVLEAIDQRKLSAQIDAVVYSTGFPWRINFAKEIEGGDQLKKSRRPMASLTGATYLFQYVLARSPGLVSLNSNQYVPPIEGQPAQTNLSACRAVAKAPTRAFRSRYVWGMQGQRAEKPSEGIRYLISTALGVTTGRGNTVQEVIQCLQRAIEAEAEPPAGTFYFMRRPGKPRSQPRDACFAGVAAELRALGAKARVETGVTPKAPARVMGLMMGHREPLLPSGVQIEPGAIVEHLTSYAGVFSENSSQLCISELIRKGATGTSGPVFEPHAIQAKFPLPSMHLHYRRGASLGEAFYLSIAAPYQLIVLGDPLCQPWARRPGLSIEGWPTGEPGEIRPGEVSRFGFAELGLDAPKAKQAKTPEDEEVLKIVPKITPRGGEGTAFWELFVDGRLRVRLPSGRGISLPKASLGPGWHSLRCVAANASLLEERFTRTGSIEVLKTADGPVPRTVLQIDLVTAELAEDVAVSAQAPGAERIVIRQNLRKVGEIMGQSGKMKIPAQVLGKGPVRLQAVAEPAGSASAPVWLDVD